ncbi:MAG: YheC/YheD family protein [Alicyclobacillus sp.]|nr:YheC/YheD family protein [Alicyclobacillus sp.]
MKPATGSIGHGMIRIDRGETGGYWVSVLKNRRCQRWPAKSLQEVWRQVGVHRLRSRYVVQAAVPLIRWRGQPCDIRVLLQKGGGQWQVVGKGVRVAGRGTITTHVPNGGSTARLQDVLQANFNEKWEQVEEDLDVLCATCATVIDQYYHQQLGEMSMDIGIDPAGGLWFFEANAKPMRFDEPDIRQRSLIGVLNHLGELCNRREGEQTRL